MIETTQNKSNHDLKMCYFKTHEARHNEHICTGALHKLTSSCFSRQNHYSMLVKADQKFYAS